MGRDEEGKEGGIFPDARQSIGASCKLTLENGTHMVGVLLSDISDNTNRVSWTFTIKEPEGCPKR